MARRKKRGSITKESSRQEAGSARSRAASDTAAQKKLPAPRPPKKNRPLLWVCIVLLAAWLVALVLLAARG